MRVVVDASSIINLCNGEVFAKVLGLKSLGLSIGPQVYSECYKQEDLIRPAVTEGRIAMLDDNRVPADLFADLYGENRMGLGETECIAFAKVDGLGVCSDDRKARRVIEKEFGKDRLFGSGDILQRCVRESILSGREALEAYGLMRIRGGFLPEVNPDHFNCLIQ